MLVNVLRCTVIRAPRRATPALSRFSSSTNAPPPPDVNARPKQSTKSGPDPKTLPGKKDASAASSSDTSATEQQTTTATQSSPPSSPEPISKAQTPGLHSPSGTTSKLPPPMPAQCSESPVPRREVTTVKPLRGVRVHPQEREWHATVVHGRGILEPFRHPRTHGVPVAFIQFRAHFPASIQLAAHFASHAAASLGIPVSGVVSLPTRRTLWTVPRGPFAHKKSQENFERRVHARAIKAFDADAEVVDRWVRYLEAHALPGVGMRVVRWHRLPVGIGRSHLQSVVGRMRLGKPTDVQKVKELGNKIVEAESQAGLPSDASA